MLLKIFFAVVFSFLPLNAQAITSAETQQIRKSSLRLDRIADLIDELESPISQMIPERAITLGTAVDDLQNSYDDIQERLAMIKLILDHERTAPTEKKVLARAELKDLAPELEELETEISALNRSISKLTKYY